MGINFLRKKPKTERLDWHLERNYIVLRALVPKENEKTPLAAEQFFASLHGIFQDNLDYQETVSFEIAAVNGFVQFYIVMPEHLRPFVEGQLYAQYPIVEVEEVPDYMENVTTEGAHIASTELALNKNDIFPLKTFLNFDVDPLASITGVMAEAGGQENIIMQLLIRPVSSQWQDVGVQRVSAIRAGQKIDRNIGEAIKGHVYSLTKNVVSNLLFGAPQEVEVKKDVQLSAPEEAALKGAEEKLTKLCFESVVRLAAITNAQELADRKLYSAIGAFKQFNTNNMNGFSSGKIINDSQLINVMKKRYFSSGYILNIEELASVYHLPDKSVETPRVAWAGSKKGEPPTNLPLANGNINEDITLFGQTNFRGHFEPFGIKQRDRSLHMYAIGKTGTGKSTLLENMIIDDIRKGRGVAVVDPHGDLIKKVINFIPEERTEDVVAFSPADRGFPVGFNVLESVDPDLKNIVASGVVGIFKKIFGESWGPRLEYILRNTILALLDYPNATLLGILRVLNDQNYRMKVIEKIEDPVIRDFFINEYEKYDQKFRTEAIAPIQNKVGQFLSSSTIRNIVGQVKSSFSLEDVMNNKKILLLDLSIGKIGEDNSALLGSIMITKMQLAAMSRANMLPEDRVPFYLYVDEFQNFATDSFAVILSEARKYKLNLIMTNQYIAQMPETVTHAVFGNVGTLISFRVGAGDASGTGGGDSAGLAQEFDPVFSASDLINLDNYHIYLKMAVDGVTTTPFSAKTLPPAENPVGNADQVIELSRKKYGRPVKQAEQDIQQSAEFDLSGEYAQKFLEKHTAQQEKAKNVVEVGEKRYKKVIDTKNERWYYGVGDSASSKDNNTL